jgi:hypothetical protein
MFCWGDNMPIEPESLKRQCHSCGRHERLDEYSLCQGCREDWDTEMDAILDAHREPAPDERSLYKGTTRP